MRPPPAGDDPEHAAKVVGMAWVKMTMTPACRPGAGGQSKGQQPRRRARSAGPRHDPAGLALDQRHVGNVKTAQLVDAVVCHLEQADLGIERGHGATNWGSPVSGALPSKA